MARLVQFQSDHLRLAMEAILHELEPDLPTDMMPELCKHEDYIDRLQMALEAIYSGEEDHVADLIQQDPQFMAYIHPMRCTIITIHTTTVPGLVLLELSNVTRIVPQTGYYSRDQSGRHLGYIRIR